MTSRFDAVGIIAKAPERSHPMTGSRVRMEGPAVRDGARYAEWLDLAKNREYLATALPGFMETALAVPREAGIVRGAVDVSKLFDARVLG